MSTTRRIMRALKLNEISGVDIPAQEGAKRVLLKRAEPEHDELFKRLGLMRPRMLTEADGHTHVIDLDDGNGGSSSWSKSEGEEGGHEHPWIKLEDGSIMIGAAEGHSHDVLMEKITVSDPLPEGDLATKSGRYGPAGGQRKDKKKKDKRSMSEKITKTADQDPAVDERIAKLEAELEFTKKLGALSDAEKAHYEKLDESGRKSFLDLDDGARRREIEKVSAADPVVYTADSGEEFRKSDDPRLVRLAKQSDEDRRLAKNEREKRESVELTKRAESELKNITGKPEAKIALLKAVDSISDEKTRDDVKSIVKAANDAMAEVFTRKGTAAPGSEDGDLHVQYEELAKKFAETNKVSIEKARSMVLDTPEGTELYSKMTGR